jgi:hypothetical protein
MHLRRITAPEEHRSNAEPAKQNATVFDARRRLMNGDAKGSINPVRNNLYWCDIPMRPRGIDGHAVVTVCNVDVHAGVSGDGDGLVQPGTRAMDRPDRRDIAIGICSENAYFVDAMAVRREVTVADSIAQGV